MGVPPHSIRAKIPYLRSDLDTLFVDYSARILGEETLDRQPLTIRNGREAAIPPSLEQEGFELTHCHSRVVQTRLTELTAERTPLKTSPAMKAYWDETTPFIQCLTGARAVYPINASAVRFSTQNTRQKMMTPAGWVHLDYDPEEAEQQLRETLELHAVTPAPYSRHVLYQSWRVLSDPPQDFPLAICDGRTVRGEDIVPIEYHMKTEAREVTYRSRGSRYSPRHQWWYFPDMTPDEMIIFKGFDSRHPDQSKTLHVAFHDETAEHPIPRSSIETRYFALFD